MPGNTYQDLEVWKEAIELSVEIYGLTKGFPSDEKFGLVSQMRRSSVSIPCNVAEGRRRRGDKEFRNFLHIAYGSGAELETQMIIARRLGYITVDTTVIDERLTRVMKMLNSFIAKLP